MLVLSDALWEGEALAEPAVRQEPRPPFPRIAFGHLDTVRHRKIARATRVWDRFHPNPAPVKFDDALANGQPHARTRVLFLVVQTLKRSKNVLGKLRFDADAVVSNTKLPMAFNVIARNVDERISVTVEF